ncbi:MAG: hypothetical protein ACREBD_13275 [Blastocatellia bacterium]
MIKSVFDQLMVFLSDLDQARISYTLAHHRDEALMVIVAAPGERWEIEFLADGTIEVERFTSNGEIYGAEALSELLARYAEQEDIVTQAEYQMR